MGVNASGGRSLFRETTQVVGTALAPLREELVDGVDQMQVLYGVDGDDDGAPDAFLTAGAVGLSTLAEWRRVVAVRIALLLSTIDEYGQEVDSNVYTLNDRADIGPFDDRRRRRIFTTTAMVRNLQ